MAYKPPVAKTSYETYSGIAKVAVGKSSVKLLFAQDKKNPVMVSKKNVPAEIRPGTWHITMDEDKTEVRYVKPYQGQHKVQFKEFTKGEDDEVPTPRTVERSFKKEGKMQEYSYEQFIALLEIVDGEAEGMMLPLYLRYHFTEVDGVTGYSHPKSKYTAQLQEFMEVAGGWIEGEMKWPEDGNVLPIIEKRLKKAGKTFFVVIKLSEKGTPYIDTFYTMIEDDFGDFDEDEPVDEPIDESVEDESDIEPEGDLDEYFEEDGEDDLPFDEPEEEEDDELLDEEDFPF